MIKRHTTLIMAAIFVSIVAFAFLNLLLGTVRIPASDVFNIILGRGCSNEIWENIIVKSRLPQALTAIFAGAGLSVAGLLMQTVFRNPLAGPSVLGISSGASLGVAFVILMSGIMGQALSQLGFFGEFAVTIAAIIGAMGVMGIIIFVSQKVKGNVTLLIIGVMIGHIATAQVRNSKPYEGYGTAVCGNYGNQHTGSQNNIEAGPLYVQAKVPGISVSKKEQVEGLYQKHT